MLQPHALARAPQTLTLSFSRCSDRRPASTPNPTCTAAGLPVMEMGFIMSFFLFFFVSDISSSLDTPHSIIHFTRVKLSLGPFFILEHGASFAKAVHKVPGCIIVSSMEHENIFLQSMAKAFLLPSREGVDYFISFTVVKKFPGRIYDYMNWTIQVVLPCTLDLTSKQERGWHCWVRGCC
jgi:hypothetical protein